jgi:hypothetical protein
MMPNASHQMNKGSTGSLPQQNITVHNLACVPKLSTTEDGCALASLDDSTGLDVCVMEHRGQINVSLKV